jgi:hypothetical protein
LGTRFHRDFVAIAPVLDGGLCGGLGRLQHEGTQLMSLVVQTYRHLTHHLGKELDQAVGISAASLTS